MVGGLAVAAVAVVATGSAHGLTSVPDGEWHHFGRDGANTKYSPLDQITAENFTDLEIAWRWTSLSRAVVEENEQIRPSAFKSSPLMADGLVYVSTALGQAAALDAGTGEPVWTYDPRIYDDMERPPNMGWHHRGLSYWKDDESDDARIFMANHDLKLVALNARTGALYPGFGENGYVDLTQGYGREIDPSRMTYSSPVAVAGDTIITGSIVQDTNIRLRARFGPLFSPPVLRGAEKPYMQVPGAGGGANWQGAAVDVETGRLFVSSSSTSIVVEVIEYPPPATIGHFTDP